MKPLLLLLLTIHLSVLAQKEDNLPINKFQVIGSHNSYKQAIDPVLFALFEKKDSVSASKIDYEHIPIKDQLDLGLRNLEIDVYPDEQGGKYAHPKGMDMATGQKPYDPEGKMKQSGFKILHIPDLDFRSHYFTFKDCLEDLRKWSDTNPKHTPVFITLEIKGIVTDGSNPNMQGVSSKNFEELDKALLEILGKEHIITPDNVRGNHTTLEDAILHSSWPTLKQARGKFLFILDDSGAKKSMYIAGHPSLKGRTMFANAAPGTSEAAMLIRNNPNAAEIKELVRKGYIIRTRADADTKEARLNDSSSFEAACSSGSQIITTDYYQKSTHFKSDYSVIFPGGRYFRVNPLF